MYSKPYTKRIDNLRMPVGYQPPKFQSFNGKGNPKQYVSHFIETCNNVGIDRDWKIGIYRRYFGEISDIGRHRNDNRHRLSINVKIGKIANISAKYRWSADKSAKNREWRHVRRSRRRSSKNQRLIGDFTDIVPIFSSFKNFDLTANFEFLRIWWPRFHPCICKGLQRSDLWSNGVKSIFTLSKGYGVFPTVIWRSNGEIWTKFWSNG